MSYTWSYYLTCEKVKQGIGFCRVYPVQKDLLQVFAYLCAHPLDWFAHKYLLEELQTKSKEEVKKIFLQFLHPELCSIFALELMRLKPELEPVLKDFATKIDKNYTPFLTLYQLDHLPDHDLHQQWLDYLKQRQILPEDKVNPPEFLPSQPAGQEHLFVSPQFIPLAKSFTKPRSYGSYEFLKTVYNKLKEQKIFKSSEFQHEQGLCPVNLWRKWKFKKRIHTQKLDYEFCAEQISFGRGFNFDEARLRLYMEMAERFSAYANICDNVLIDLKEKKKLYVGSYAEISKKHLALDPAQLHPDLPYTNEPLFWIKGVQKISQHRFQEIFLPAQLVFLFFNPGEVQLASSLGSTGLAAGKTIEQARLNGLLEIIERDSEALSLFSWDKVFEVDFKGSKWEDFFARLKKRKIFVYFQDLSAVHGVPCFKAFIVTKDNKFIKGCAAHLNSLRALLSAATEIPYGVKAEVTQQLEVGRKKWSDFLDFSSNETGSDLDALENHLLNQKLYPIYVDLTHADLNIPVVRSVLPDLEPLPDFDFTSRLSKRLYSLAQSEYFRNI
ncbi:MAG: YcaO-like family protein [Desulfonauticus sp.]|nr:YcaO-like family protein [Desulfonauticus sp.]